jgi:hypothetical protein
MIKRIAVIAGIAAGTTLAAILIFGNIGVQAEKANAGTASAQKPEGPYQYPAFYKGFYLTCQSGTNRERLISFLEKAKNGGLNTVVIDVQTPGMKKAMTPKENIDLCIQMGFHPIARVVVFPDGLKKYPVPDDLIENRLAVAEEAAAAGYKEIQFDYIRFNDVGVLKHVPLAKRYEMVNGFLKKAKDRLAKYNIKTAADVFGRIPLNKDDGIGQKMELLDEVVDIICPMAYPSHYTWSAKMMADPYYTVYTTSLKGRERLKKAEVVTWIQAFKMKVQRSGLTYDVYVEQQIKACHDAGIKGYIMWNAAQEYTVPLVASARYYSTSEKKSVTVK